MTSAPTPTADRLEATPLVVRTTTLQAPEVESLVAALPPSSDPAGLCSWVRGGDGMVGWGRTVFVRTDGADRFTEAQRWWRTVAAEAVVRDEVGLPGTGLVCFGSMAYADSSPSGGTLVVPEVVLGRRRGRWWVTTITRESLTPTPLVQRQAPPEPPGQVAFSDGALGPGPWSQRVAEAVRRITRGELDKVVLARDLQVDAADPIDARWLLHRLTERYDNTWVFAVDGLVGATPEMLVRLERGLVTSRVLAGTIRRTGNDEQDLTLAASLARSSKDLEEHEYAVRSVADALAGHCSSMNVPEAPFVLHLPNVMHLATDVAGVVDDGSTSLALAQSLHPSAAVCGTPREAADAVIAELEGMDRGRYAGTVGWMSADGDGEWGIALRSGAFEPGDARRMRLFAGCGIVAGSDPRAEVAESDAKLVPMRDALSC